MTMSRTEQSTRILMAGAVVSVAIHLLVATGFVRWSRVHGLEIGAAPAEREKHPDSAPPPEQQRQKPDIRLGIDRSEAATMTWLGFETPTEHAALQATVEQSAMTLAAPGVSAPTPPNPAPAAPVAPETPEMTRPLAATPEVPVAAAPAEAQDPSPVPPLDEAARQEVLKSVRQAAEAVTAAGERVAAFTQDLAALLERVPPPPAPRAKGQDQPDPAAPTRRDPAMAKPLAPAPTPPATPNQAGAKPAGAAGQQGAPGNPSDKESIATAVKNSAATRLDGKVLAAQGLEIQTRRPRWEYTTMLTRQPRNPTLRITFGADGKVKRAEFVRDGSKIYNTGFDDVDEPLLTAIYSWTAKGKVLSEATKGDPDAGVTIMLTIILVG